jgi:hypothetical protein
VEYRVAGIYRRRPAGYFDFREVRFRSGGEFSMLMSTQQKKHVSLTVSAVCDLMNDTLRTLERPDRAIERAELIRALQLGVDEIELLWEELRNRPDS